MSTVSLGEVAAESRLTAKLFVVPLALAVSIAVCAVLTGATVAEKLAVVAPSATVTEVGTVTAAELLDRVTAWPPVEAAELSVTVQLSVPPPVIEALAQVRLLTTPDDSAFAVMLAFRAEYAHAVRFARTKQHTNVRQMSFIHIFERKLERFTRALLGNARRL